MSSSRNRGPRKPEPRKVHPLMMLTVVTLVTLVSMWAFGLIP